MPSAESEALKRGWSRRQARQRLDVERQRGEPEPLRGGLAFQRGAERLDRAHVGRVVMGHLGDERVRGREVPGPDLGHARHRFLGDGAVLRVIDRPVGWRRIVAAGKP